MLIFRLMTALAFGALTAGTAVAAPPADIVLPSAFHDGMTYVQVSINGATPRWMGLDDGTSPSVLDLDYAKSLDLPLKPGAGSGTGFGTQKVLFFTTKADIAAGGSNRSHADFSAARLSGMIGPDGQQLAGVLGYSFLKDRILVIDYPRREIRFAASSRACTCDIPFRFDNDIPSIPVTVGGRRMTALIDSGGAYELLITPAGARSSGLQAWLDQATPHTGYGYAGAQSVLIGQAPDLTVGEFVVAMPQTVYSTFGTAPLKSQAALGVHFLEHYKVTLNYRAHTVRFEP